MRPTSASFDLLAYCLQYGRLPAVIATLVCLLAGGLLVGVSVTKAAFSRLVGPTITAQYRFQKRIPNSVEYSESSYLNSARVIFIVLGSLLILFGLAGVAVLV